MQSSFSLPTATGLIALALVVVPLAGAAAQKGGAAPRVSPSTPKRIIVPRLPKIPNYGYRRDKKSGSDAGHYRDHDHKMVGALVRSLVAPLEKYPQHKKEVAELHRILAIYEKASTQLAALETGGDRTRSLKAMQIGQVLAQESADLKKLKAKFMQRLKAGFDEVRKEAKSNRDAAKKFFRKALLVLIDSVDLKTQSARRLSVSH